MIARWKISILIFVLTAPSQADGQEATWRQAFSAGRQHYEGGRYADAEKSLQRAAELARAGSDDLADSWNWLGLAQWKLAKYPDAEAAHLKARALYQKLHGESSAEFAYSTNNLGLVYWVQGRLKEGDKHLKQALDILKEVEGANGINLARGLNNTGGLYRSRGYWKKAEPMLLRSIEIWEFLKFKHGDAAHSYGNFGRLRAKQGKLAEAVELYQKALDVSKKKLTAQHPQVGEHMCYLGDLLREQGKLDAAEKLLLGGMKIIEVKLPKEHSLRASSLRYLAELRRAQGKTQDALPLFEQSLAIWAKHTVQPMGAAESHLGLARLSADTGNAKVAGEHFRSAITIFEKTVGAASPDLADALELHAKFLQPTDVEQAANAKERAAAVRKQHAEENR